MISSEPQDSSYGAKRYIKDVVAQIPGQLCSLLHLPGFIQAMDYADMVTGDRIIIHIGRRYTVITINSRDYWFRRISGKFDGTGYSISVAGEGASDCILDYIPVSTPSLGWWGRLKRLMPSIGRGRVL